MLEKPFSRRGEEEPKDNEKYDSNQNSYSEHKHGALLSLNCLYPIADAGQYLEMTESNGTLRRNTTLLASELNTPNGANNPQKWGTRRRGPGQSASIVKPAKLARLLAVAALPRLDHKL
ncbi:MAG TPA: hypothetical protein VNU92_10840 [Edaphobacter sp.]|nr:hypothetical protein [Edaphobacter sp.]